MKLRIIKFLEDHRGEFISGELLANKLGITRAGVWKNILSLRQDGYKIKSVPKRGYMLENDSDLLTEEGIKANLNLNSKITKIICLDKIDSTNNYAKKLALQHADNGTLIVANSQTGGRGRQGHKFISPPGTGLYMTLILRPSVNISEFQMITIAAAVSVCRSIEDLCGETGITKIKWVNDIYMRERKISGILTEAVTNFENGEIESVVTGIGINVTTENFNESAGNAGSIFEAGNKIKFTRDKLAARISDYLINYAEDLSNPEIINFYRDRSFLIGHDITYMKNNLQSFGHVISIDEYGGLEIINNSGEKEILRSGEVFTVRKND